MKTKILIILGLIVSIASICGANTTIYVDVNGPNDPGTGSLNDPFRKIQDAIDAAQNGDTVEIRPGLYTGYRNYDLDPNGKSITIRSTNPQNPEIVANTIIDPNHAGRGFRFINGEDTNCAVSGLTIRNGLAADDSGGAVLCYNSNPTISNCIIKNNAADWYGGALFCYSSGPEIINCTITGNSAHDGGALECWPCTSQLKNCIISDNHAVSYGGGVDCYNQGNLILINCTLVGNSVEDGFGGAICSWDSNVDIRNSIICTNEALLGPQLVLLYGSSASVGYCNVQGGQTGAYIDTGCVLTWDDNSNIDADPCFAAFDTNGDSNLWDLHLQSEYGRWKAGNQSWVMDSNTSLCIDAGDPNSDWTAEPWPNGKRINMGAYGGTGQASKNGNLADFDVNGVVNSSDLMEFTSKWLDEEGGIVNLNLTGRVDFRDFAIFAKNWLWQK